MLFLLASQVYAECAPDATRCSTDAEDDEEDAGDVEENIKAMFAA